MRQINSDALFRQIAFEYAEEYGKSLKNELLELEREDVLRTTPRLDRKVLGEVAARKRRRAFRVIGALAACLLLAVLVPRMLDLSQNATQSQLSPSAPSAGLAVEEAAPETAVEEAAPFDAPEWEIMEEPAATEEEATADAQEPVTGGGAVGIIPLSFALPDNLSIIAIEQDNERSIYYLSDVLQDDVVLTLEETDREPETEGLASITINDSVAYGVAGPDYSLLTFQKDGILYEMTCEHDLATLVNLSYHIL